MRHRRHRPLSHRFTYPVTLLGLDLRELPALLARTPWHGARGPALHRYRRQDYLQQLGGEDLASAVRRHCQQEHIRADGRLTLVTTLRSFGTSFNPVSFVLVHARDGAVTAVLAEITNTPWNERHIYTLPLAAQEDGAWRFAKRFHVSPFNGMEQDYAWRLRIQGDALAIGMQNFEHGRCCFDATLSLRLSPATPSRLWRSSLGPPAALLTLWRIYRQAAALFRKRTPFHAHPATREQHHPLNSCILEPQP
jgi:uncharacterized protein